MSLFLLLVFCHWLITPRLGSAHLVIVGGLAELFSGAISMGLGAYLAAVTDRDLYDSEERRERDEVANQPEAEKAEIYEIFEEYDVDYDSCKGVVQALERNPSKWIKVRRGRREISSLPAAQWRTDTLPQFMMTFELKLEKPNIARAWISAATMGASYFIGESENAR